MPKTTWMLVCHILAITKLVRLVKGPLLLASTAAHQRLAQDSVVHQNIRGLEIYTVGCTCAAPRAFFTFTGASTPSETLTGQKKDTSGDDTPAGPQRGPRRWPFGPRELLRDPLRVTRRARHILAPAQVGSYPREQRRSRREQCVNQKEEAPSAFSFSGRREQRGRRRGPALRVAALALRAVPTGLREAARRGRGAGAARRGPTPGLWAPDRLGGLRQATRARRAPKRSIRERLERRTYY